MFKHLSMQNHLSKGSSLWILRTPTSSLLAKEIDWYLSFMYSKLKTTSMLLVESSLFLPNRHTLFIPMLEKTPQLWIRQAYKHWADLNKPSLRLFLPPSINLPMIKEHWEAQPLPYEINICMEL